MNDATDILKEEFESLRVDLIAKYDELGMRASGQWADSLQVEVSGTNAKITGLHYSDQLEYGRKPGAMPPSEAIEKWIINKGIANRIEGNISISSLAYLIARKIAREGWKRENHGGVELISEVVTPERIQSILDRIGEMYTNTFTRDIINYLKAA